MARDPKTTVSMALCRSGKFETGHGTCSLICMDQLGDPRGWGCRHAHRVHGDLAAKILNSLEEGKD